MLYAVVARCPVFGGKVASFDAAKTKAMPGVKHVLQISSGVAVVADNTWSAMQARNALAIQWDEGQHANVNSAGIRKEWEALSQQPGAVGRKDGDAAAALAGAAKKIEAVYEAPYLAHAPMEPLNCVADVRADSCEVWASTQGQSTAHQEAIRITGLRPDQVKIHTEYMGGGFGRRARSDYIADSVEISKALGVPVKVTWSREDDMQQDRLPPRLLHALLRQAWTLTAGPWRSTAAWSARPSAACATASRAPASKVSSICPTKSPTSWWIITRPIPEFRSATGAPSATRRTRSSPRASSTNSPRRPGKIRSNSAGALLAKPASARPLAVLELVAEKAGWGKPLPKGRGRGIALVNNIGSFTAQVAEVSVENGKLRVHRVVCAVDCGQVVNPAGVEQQIQSGIVYGLSAALKGAITIDRGRVQQTNFHQYDVLRIDEMPVVEVHIVPSHATPGGIGEASVPPIAAAVGNAIFAATGKRLRRLPMRVEDLV